MDLEELEKAVQLQEDIQEIENLERIYGYYFDNNMWAEIIDLFSDTQTESVEIADHGVSIGICSTAAEKGVILLPGCSLSSCSMPV